jgi:hypothetical protein
MLTNNAYRNIESLRNQIADLQEQLRAWEVWTAAQEQEECGCVTPEQSCPACRAAAANIQPLEEIF